jgi:predicted dehydrogenase
VPEKNILLAGLGPHARRIYYPLLEKYAARYGLRLPLLIDTRSQEAEVRRYLHGRAIQPEALYFIDDSDRQQNFLPLSFLPTLHDLMHSRKLDGIIVSTEPQAHKAYVLWAIQNSVNVLLDKPVTAPPRVSNDVRAARQVYEDYLEMEALLRESHSNVIIQAQRRGHNGYLCIKDYLLEFIRQFAIPLSYLDIYHADGMWAMPDELFARENHPYKYGYGKLMHSGYHFIDLFAWLTEVNELIASKAPDSIDITVRRFTPYDFLHQVDAADYERLFGVDRFAASFTPEKLEAARAFGEQDVYILCQLKRGDWAVTTAAINLQQNSFSRRAWEQPALDGYKGNGRVRHERLNLQVGNLLNIQAHSYQAYEAGKQPAGATGAGSEDHFELHVYRNSDLVGGAPLEKIDIGETMRGLHAGEPHYLGHNERARETLFLDFLERRAGTSHFSSHRRTVRLLSAVYEAIANQHPRLVLSL